MKLYKCCANDGERKSSALYRNFIAFWMLGLCVNYAYYIMLSAAHDILDQTDDEIFTQNFTLLNTTFDTNTTEEEEADERDCNKLSTGVILMASVIPALVVKFIAPFVTSYITLQLVGVIVLNAGSFLLVSLSQMAWMTYAGVVLASMSGGLGEVTLLKLQTIYDKNSLSAFSSGCGFSGLMGSFSYAGIIAGGITPRNTLLMMTTLPVIMAFTYFVILGPPTSSEATPTEAPTKEQDPQPVQNKDNSQQDTTEEQPVSKWMHKLQLMKVLLLKYILPLVSVYFCQYFINQGLFELMYFRGIWLNHEEQYRWYQVVYQLGVFISKSSVNVILFDKLWLLAILQMMNMVVFVTEAYLLFLPSIWIVFVVILWEGLIGGCCYVSTYFKISKEVEEVNKQFAIAVTSFGETLGVVMASFLAIPVHQLFCQIIPIDNVSN